MNTCQPRTMCCLAVLFVCFWWACSTDRPTGATRCDTTPECPPNQVCIAHGCHTPCTSQKDCPKSEVCLSGACLKPCGSDQDCGSKEFCNRGYCEPKDNTQDGGVDGGNTTCVDWDKDGYGINCEAGPDCDDANPSVHPNALEICQDGADNDCDGKTDETDCGCPYGVQVPCYAGPAGTIGVGICRSGVAACQLDGTLGPCLAQRLPETEICDGVDNNCNGQADEGLLNRCGACSPSNDQLIETCGNGLDDNCDGQVDEGCNTCDPGCQCQDTGHGVYCACHPPVHQPCYSGPPNTLGFGACRGGFHDCVAQGNGGYAWSACAGEQLPQQECQGGPNGIDDDCDGMTDEGCLPDLDGDGVSPPDDCNDNDPNIHPGAIEVCNGKDDNCNGLIDEGAANACGGCGAVPNEVCADGLDNNCDGNVDEGCGGCSGGSNRQCYRGPPSTVGVGSCSWGSQTCDGEFWGQCTGDVVPQPEVCDGADNDCDAQTDEPGAIGANACGFCSGTEICDNLDNDCDGLTDEELRNSCGQCLPVANEMVCDGQDNDCDGLTDEQFPSPCGDCSCCPAGLLCANGICKLLNSCGTCGNSCYEQDWGGADDWPNGTADGVSNTVNPDELRLDSQTQSPHYIWIAGSNELCNGDPNCHNGCYAGEDCHTVRKYDTLPPYELLGKYSSWGWSPSRTAVAVDNSVWVGNRGCHNLLSQCDSNGNNKHGNGVHLDVDGNLICRADVPYASGGEKIAVRAVTIDKESNVWLGSWDMGKIYKYSGSLVDANADGTPRCRYMCEVDLQGSKAYGAAVDSNGYLWIANTEGPVAKIRTSDCTLETRVTTGYATYGVAIDQNNNPWFGCWSTNCAYGAIKLAWDQNQQQYQTYGIPRQNPATTGQTRGVAVDRNGDVWVADWTNEKVLKFASNGTALGQWGIDNGSGAQGPLGMAVAFDDNIWAIDYTSGHASIFSPNGMLIQVIRVGNQGAAYTYSDATGFQLRHITLKHGTWTVNFDSGYVGARWDSVEWSGSLAADDKIRIRVRSAASETELGAAAWSPFHDADPNVAPPWTANITGQVPDGRWLQLQVTLETQDDNSPVFRDLKVHWQY